MLMNIQSFLSSATSTISTSRRPETDRVDRDNASAKSAENTLQNSVFLPADVGDLEFKAQQRAERREIREQGSKESEAFLQTQELPSGSSLGQFIDIQA